MKLPGVKPPEPGKAVRVHVDGADVAIFNVGGNLYGIDAKCSHVGGPLDQGHVSGTTVTCPWHGSEFDVTSGAVIRGPATRPEKGYRVRVESDGIVVDST
jgi:nitrite reductase/ring-hydroxylating ferredoxin subunit